MEVDKMMVRNLIFYAVYYNPCVYESAAGLVSLHGTKANAYKRMRSLKVEQAMQERENHKYRMKGWTKRKPCDWQVWFVHTVQVED